jgi:type II secretory pathway pseudopilin PulG
MIALAMLVVMCGILLNVLLDYVTQKTLDQKNRHHAELATSVIEQEQNRNPNVHLTPDHIKAAVEIELHRANVTNPFVRGQQISVMADSAVREQTPGNISVVLRSDRRYTVIAFGTGRWCPTFYDVTKPQH